MGLEPAWGVCGGLGEEIRRGPGILEMMAVEKRWQVGGQRSGEPGRSVNVCDISWTSQGVEWLDGAGESTGLSLQPPSVSLEHNCPALPRPPWPSRAPAPGPPSRSSLSSSPDCQDPPLVHTTSWEPR